VILAGNSTLDFPLDRVIADGGARVSESALTLEAVERKHIKQVLEQTHGVIHGPKGAARLLGLNPSTLRSRMQKLGLRIGRRDISQSSRDSANGGTGGDG
jgi:DNA-binding NtrC family response regulator